MVRALGRLEIQRPARSTLRYVQIALFALSCGPKPAADIHNNVVYQLYTHQWTSLDRPPAGINLRTLETARLERLSLAIWQPDPAQPEAQPESLEALQASLKIAQGILERREVLGWISMEGTAALGDDPTQIDHFLSGGVKVVGLAHLRTNAFIDSATDQPQHGGLSVAGQALAQRVLDQGAILDTAHASEEAARDLIGLSRMAGRPIISSHTAARALCDHPRNITDSAAKEIADTGGLIGVIFHSPYLHCGSQGKRADVAILARHIHHLVALVGSEHVALGTDWAGLIITPVGLSEPTGLPLLARALRDTGMSRSAIQEVFSGNAAKMAEWLTPQAPARLQPKDQRKAR